MLAGRKSRPEQQPHSTKKNVKIKLPSMCTKTSRIPMKWKEFVKIENYLSKSHSKRQSRTVEALRQRRKLSCGKTLTQCQFHPTSNWCQIKVKLLAGANEIWNAVNIVAICCQMSLNVMVTETQRQNVVDGWGCKWSWLEDLADMSATKLDFRKSKGCGSWLSVSMGLVTKHNFCWAQLMSRAQVLPRMSQEGFFVDWQFRSEPFVVAIVPMCMCSPSKLMFLWAQLDPSSMHHPN